MTMTTQLLLNDSQQRTVVINGLESIAKLIRRFSEIEAFYLRKTQHRLCKDLEEALEALYFHVLEFEARCLCHLNRSTASQTSRNIVKADGWQDILDNMDKSEITCNILTRIIDVETQHKWNEQIEALVSDQASKVEMILKLSEQIDGQSRQPLARSETIKEDKSTIHQDRDGLKCLALLRTTDYEFDKNKNPIRLAGTCEWFLNHPVYRKWKQQDGRSWLWLTANPGCGKSVLARSLVDEFCGTATESHIYYFFFKDDSENNRNVNHALCAILHQLMCRDRSLLRYAMDVYHANGEQLPNLLEPLWKILLAILERLPNPVVLLFDALDECAEFSRLLLIEKLAILMSHERENSKLKVIMTSRPNTPIGNAIWRYGYNPMSIQLSGEREVESQAISDEIDLYIGVKMEHFRDLRKYRGIHDDAHELLLSRLNSVENRTYLWVSLIFPELEKAAGISETKLLVLIEQIPTTVQDAYEKILDRSMNKPRARTLLHMVVGACRSLTLTEMNFALAVQDHSDPMMKLDTDPAASFAETIRELCGLFILIQDDRIYLIHQTAKEFLVQMDERDPRASANGHTWSWRYSFDPVKSHRLLARTCILYLYLSRLRHEALTAAAQSRINGPLQEKGEAWNYLETWKSFHGYAGRFWMDHFSAAKLFDMEDILSPVAQISTPNSPEQQSLSWTQLYQTAPDWSPFPPRDSREIRVNALAIAAFCGHASMVTYFLTVFSATEKGILSIRWGLQNKHTSVAHILLDSISSTSENSHILNAAFHMACNAGEGEIVSRLLTSAVVDPFYADSLGRTALYWAARGGHELLVQTLIKLQEQRCHPKLEVRSSLLVAAFRGFRAVIAALMSYAPAESNDCRIAALHQAVIQDQAQVLRLLLEDRGSLVVSQSELEDLIILAVTVSSKASVKTFLQYPLNVNVRDVYREPLLLLAEDQEVKELLISMGADVNAIADSGWSRCYAGVGETGLYRAVVNDDYKYAELFLQHGAALDIRCRNGETALYRASDAGSLELVRSLLNAGANPTIRNQYGSSPMQLMKNTASTDTNDPTVDLEDCAGILALIEDAITKIGGHLSDSDLAVPLEDHIMSPQVYRQLFNEDPECINWEEFEQLLEMDDGSEPYWTRAFVWDFFRSKQPLAKAEDAMYVQIRH